MKKELKIIYSYTFIGFFFGSLFPLSTYIYELLIKRNISTFSLSTLFLLHKQIDLLYVIDTAPLFLGFFSFLAGVNYSKSYKLNLDLIKIQNDLRDSQNKLVVSSKLLKEKNNTLEKDFFFDKLTGLGNENGLLKAFIPDSSEVLIMYINISHFREINAIFGYGVGDGVLIELSNRLKENGFECYKGHADEFILIDYNKVNFIEIDSIANYLFNLLSDNPYIIGDKEIFLTVNIGFASFNKRNSTDVSLLELLHNANFALKYAKEKNLRYAFYNSDSVKNLENVYSYNWKKTLMYALKEGMILAFYQPIINNTNGKVEKYEALMRLKDHNNKFVSPYFFIASAKKYGLYNNLTRIMISEVFKKIDKVDKEISINISVDDIQDISTIKFLYKKLQSLGPNLSKKIVFELVESEGIENYNEVKTFINEVKKYNCKIAIDDFGSGYSNFNHILNLSIDYIKIDASIIKNILSDKNSEYIAKLIVDFSNKIGIKTIAEFVSSEEIFKKTKLLGIDYSQGFYFSEPLERIN